MAGHTLTANGAERMNGLIPEAYAPFAQGIFAPLGVMSAVTTAADVAESVWCAANASGATRHYPGGADAVALAA